MFQYKLSLLSVFTLINIGLCAKFPTDIERCKYGDVKCIAKVSNEILRSSPTGRADVGFPSLDPFHIISLDINEGGGGPVNLKLKFTNTTVEGLSNVTFYNLVGFEKDPRTSKFEMKAKVSELRFKGLYKSSGRILVLPVEGEGDYDVTVKDAEVSIKFKPTITTKNGKTYLRIDKLKIFAIPSKVTMGFGNLFNGDKLLGDNMNVFLNDNWKDVWEEISPALFPAISEIVKNIIKKFFTDFAYEDIFLSE